MTEDYIQTAKSILGCVLSPIATAKAVYEETQGRWRYVVYPAFMALLTATLLSRDPFVVSVTSAGFVGAIVTAKHTYAYARVLLRGDDSAHSRRLRMVGFIKKESPRLDDFVAKFESSSDFGVMYDVLTSDEITSSNGRLHWSPQ